MAKHADTLDFKDGEELIEFFIKAKKMEEKIILQKDKTGQSQ